MNNLFSIFTDNSLANAVLMFLVLPIIIGVIDKYFDFFVQLLFEKKNDNLWKKTVLKNKNVKECIDSYKQLGSENNFALLYLYIGGALGTIVPIIVTEVCLQLADLLLNIKIVTENFNMDQLVSLILPFSLLIIILLGIYATYKIYLNSKNYEKDDCICLAHTQLFSEQFFQFFKSIFSL